MGMQLSLFDDVRTPTWEDAQKKRARAVRHGAYAHPCISSCMWADDVHGGRCYLFAKPIVDGMCPSTTHLEWS